MSTSDRTSATGGPPEPPGAEGTLEPGHALGDYVIRGKLGEGGFGIVYRAEHARTGKSVAIKVIHVGQIATEELVQRFLREARTTQMIQHPGIVEVLELNSTGYLPYIVMELLEGVTLKQLIEARGALSPWETCELLLQVLAPLEAAHALRVVHRDVKPSNILLSRDGEAPRWLKLLDFGIAKLLRPEAGDLNLTSAGSRLGSSIAMAPEQLRGETVDERADIYAVGVLIFYMLAGRPPFQGAKLLEIEKQHLLKPPPRVSQFAPVSAEWDELIGRCMEKDRDRRFSSVAELREALLRLQPSPRSASSDAEFDGTGLALLASVQVGGEDEQGDAYEEAATALEFIQERVRSAGLQVTLETSELVLATSVLDLDPGKSQPSRQEVVELVTRLWTELAPWKQRAPSLRIRLCLHCDRCVVRGTQIVGGSLIDTDAWGLDEPGSGLSATAGVVAGFEDACSGELTVLERRRS